MRLALVSVLCCMPLSAQIVTGGAAAQAFVYQGKPIHPFCVDFPFSPDPSSMDLRECSTSNVVPKKDKDGWLEAERSGEDRGRVSYRVLAKHDDLFLIANYVWGGGSGQFTYLAWLRLSPQQLTQVIPVIGGGDRCIGSLYDYVIVDRRTVQFSMSTPSSMIVDLTEIQIDGKLHSQLRIAPPFCDGHATYRYDLATDQLDLISVTIDAKPEDGDTPIQACFNRLAARRKSPLKPDQLREFGKQFAEVCTTPEH